MSSFFFGSLTVTYETLTQVPTTEAAPIPNNVCGLDYTAFMINKEKQSKLHLRFFTKIIFTVECHYETSAFKIEIYYLDNRCFFVVSLY